MRSFQVLINYYFQGLTLEQISELKLSPAQVAQLRLTEDQIADMDEDQYEVNIEG